MARKPNYNFEKRSKELRRQAKKDAKREERTRRKAEEIPVAEREDVARRPEDRSPETPR